MFVKPLNIAIPLVTGSVVAPLLITDKEGTKKYYFYALKSKDTFNEKTIPIVEGNVYYANEFKVDKELSAMPLEMFKALVKQANITPEGTGDHRDYYNGGRRRKRKTQRRKRKSKAQRRKRKSKSQRK